MALQVWLPLNGNLNNNGILNPTVVNNGATVATTGKIGSCYSFDGSDDFISIDDSNLYRIFTGGSQPFSIAFWVYRADTSRAIIFGDYSLSGTIGFNVEFTTSHAVRFYWNGAPDQYFNSCPISTSVWAHIALTYDGTTLTCYKDGVLGGTWTGPLSAKNKTSGVFYLGRDSRTGSTALNGRLNDFRIYDHALSPREVAEIAKGLVLHYPLNRSGFGANNLHKDSNNLGSSWGKEGATVSNGIATIVGNGSRIYQLPANGDWTWQANTKYTVSIEARSDDGSAFSFRPYGANAANSSNISTTTEWKRYYYTFTSSSSVSTSSMSYVGNSNIQVRRPKLELGSVVTPWVPNSADTIYTTMGLNGTTVADTSGYCHNGTATALTYSSDTPRYSVSPYFNGSTSKIAVPNIYTTGVKNTQMSFAFWMKRDNYSDSKDHHIYNDICRIYTYSGDYKMRISWEHDTASSTANNTWAPGLSVPANQWHHVCFTYDSGVMKVYSDGVLYGTSDRTNTGQFIGVYNSGFVGWRDSQQYGGCLSDFRIYATALTADQVKQLYEAPISLANNGTLFANEFNET